MPDIFSTFYIRDCDFYTLHSTFSTESYRRKRSIDILKLNKKHWHFSAIGIAHFLWEIVIYMDGFQPKVVVVGLNHWGCALFLWSFIFEHSHFVNLWYQSTVLTFCEILWNTFLFVKQKRKVTRITLVRRSCLSESDIE